jgi:ferric-dicitrate binding protein FerR (iron transport regulator)
MKVPPRFGADRLWQRVADAQDQAVARASLADQDPLQPVTRALSSKVASKQPASKHLIDKHLVHPRRSSVRVFAFGTAIAACAGAAVFAYKVSGRGSVSTSDGDNAGVVGAAGDHVLVADARSDLPLKFADGSTVIFRSGSVGRMRRLPGTGAEVKLERGRLEAHVVHAANTLWLVHAGPYRVRVTGTRFAMTWAAKDLEVMLYEGSVVIDGALLGAGVPLRAGQRLNIASGVVLIEPLAALSSAVAAPTPGGAQAGEAGEADEDTLPPESPQRLGQGQGQGQGHAPSSVAVASPAARAPTLGQLGKIDDVGSVASSARPPRTHGRGIGQTSSQRDSRDLRDANARWLALAERGAYPEALAEARRLGWSNLCRRLDAHQLLTLGDVARYSGARPQAERAFRALVTRFPNDRLAADAVFSLGRLAFESRRPDEATRWFRRYVADWPDGALADQAAGRLVECAIRLDDRQAARGAARAYLTRAPHGPQATLARDVLEQ